jgi:hypothetical protein
MTAARCVVLTICALGIASAQAASPVPLGDPFHVRGGESAELAHGVTLTFLDVSEGRCSGTCVWQGEALVEIELQVKGQTARGSVTTEIPDRTLLAHRVKLLGLYPHPRQSEERPAKEYVAVFRVADVAPASAKAYASRAPALAAASRYVDAYKSTARQVCVDWQTRQLASYVEDSSDLCWMIGTVLPTAHAVNEDAGTWRFYFMVDNPQMRTRANEPLYFYVAIPRTPKDAFDQVRESDIHMLPCDVTLLDETAHGGCNTPAR